MKIQKVYIIICCKLQVDKKYILFWNSGFAFHQFFHYFSLLLNITWWMYLLVVTLLPSWHEDKHKGHLLCMVVMLYKSIYVPSIYQVFAVDRIWSWVGVAKRRCLLFLTLTSPWKKPCGMCCSSKEKFISAGSFGRCLWQALFAALSACSGKVFYFW